MVGRQEFPRHSASFDFYSPEEVWALARAANDEQDAAIYLIGGLAGLRRGEICALRLRGIDFEKRAIRVEINVVAGRVGPIKGGRGRAIPMVREVAEALARLSQRGLPTGREDPVFPGDGGWLDGSALRRRFVIACEKAELRVLRVHDLRHTFDFNAINRASLVQVQAWMGHADSGTTMRICITKGLKPRPTFWETPFARRIPQSRSSSCSRMAAQRGIEQRPLVGKRSPTRGMRIGCLRRTRPPRHAD